MNKRISDHRKFEKDPEELKKERQRARERMRYVKPKIAGKVLAHHRYWSVQFLELYLERCDETAFDVPADAYLLAQQAPEMARRIRVGPEPGEFDSPLDKMSGIVMALAVKGSCCRAHAEIEEADLCFRRAFDGLRGREAAPRVMAELHRRYAALLAVVKSPDAEKHLDLSLKQCRADGYQAGEATALALRGYIRSEKQPAEAIVDFIQASRMADLRSQRGRRTAKAALHNVLGTVATRPVGLRDQETALKLLQKLKNELKGTPKSVRKLRVLWIEGRLLGNLRIERHAERQLRKARKGFLGLEKLVDYAIVSVDLIHFLLSAGEPEKARKLAAETGQVIETSGRQDWQLEIVREWCQRDLTMPDTEEVRKELLGA